jgi:selenocysteine lyase/cysteine desulfurase
MFGYPTGLGALLIHKDAYHLLQKPWFAGGTVTLASVMADRHFLENNHAKFEDGTINYLNIPALKIGIDFIREIGIETINKRIRILTDYFLNEVKKLLHSNGQPLIQIFGPKNTENRGGTVILNFFDTQGEVIPFYEVEKITNKNNISIRSGCFCNPGIDEINHHLKGDRILEFFDSRDGGNYDDMVKYLEKMRGAIRVSFGIVSNFKDVQILLKLMRGMLK